MPAVALATQEWVKAEQLGLRPNLDLDELVLNWTSDKVRDLEVKGAIVSINLDRTIEGGSTVVVTLADPEGKLFAGGRTVARQRGLSSKARTAYRKNPVEVDEGWQPLLTPDVVGRAVEVQLDGVVFRLVKVRYSTATQRAELTFEDRIIYWLKRKRGERRVPRSTCTRAEFALSLLREIKARNYRFVCPELHVRQPIGSGRKTTVKPGTRSSSQAGGFSADTSFTIKGARATPDQKRNLDGVLTECQAQGTSADVMVATVCGVIQESVAKRLGYGDAAGPDSRGLFQQRAPWGPMSVRLDPRGSTRLFLTGGRGGQPGWKQKNDPQLRKVPGGIEHAVTAVQGSVGGYVQHQAEAERIVHAWGGASAEGAAATTGTYTKSYQFTRNADENSWTALQRLATEVGWRCFVVGNSVYFMSELDLYARRVRYQVRPDDPAVLDLTYDVDWGKPTSELELQVVLERWGAPPGSVVLLDGFGPPDGRWLVASVSRDYFSPTATVSCRQPGKEQLEPANEQVTRASNAVGVSGASAGADDGTKAGKFYAEAKQISDAGGTYVYGGGHGPPLRSLSSGQGLDCSSSTSLALFRAGLMPGSVAQVSGWFARSYGQPGRGERFTVWANDGHVWTQFHGIGNAWRFDTSPYGSGGRGPRLRSTPRPTDGFTARHWPGC